MSLIIVVYCINLLIYIATFGNLGRPYVMEDQLPHGGSITKSGFDIPYYNPGIYSILAIISWIQFIFFISFNMILDHGPTISAEEAKPPLAEEDLHCIEVINHD